MSDFARRLEEALDRAGAPQKHAGRTEWLAKLLDMSQASASRWLSGDTVPTRDRMQAVARKLKVDLAWLETGIAPDAAIDVGMLTAVLRGSLSSERKMSPEKLAQQVVRLYVRCTTEGMKPAEAEVIARFIAVEGS